MQPPVGQAGRLGTANVAYLFQGVLFTFYMWAEERKSRHSLIFNRENDQVLVGHLFQVGGVRYRKRASCGHRLVLSVDCFVSSFNERKMPGQVSGVPHKNKEKVKEKWKNEQGGSSTYDLDWRYTSRAPSFRHLCIPDLGAPCRLETSLR